VVAIALVWQWMYHADFGLLNYLGSLVGLAPVDWLGNPKTALVAVMIVSIWVQVGYQMVVFLAGLQGIPQVYLDAARVDGASAWQRFRHVTIPLLRPVTLFVLVTGVITSFQVFTLVYVLTDGGPLHATDVIVYRIYQMAWEFLQFGGASFRSGCSSCCSPRLGCSSGCSDDGWSMHRREGGRGKREGWTLGTVSVVLLGLTMLLPFLYMISTALMDEFEVLRYPPALVPVPPRVGNFPAALTALPFWRFFVNSGVVSLAVVAGQVLTSAAAAYAFARLKFPGRDRIFLVFLSVLMVPAVVLVIPRFLIVNALGWVDSYAGLISTELVSVWGIFLLRQFFQTLPRELEDAARLDGAGEWRIFWRVILPLSRPALATLAVFAFVDQWKSFLWPLVVTRSVRMQTVEIGIAAFHGIYSTNWPYQMAAAVAAVLPLVVLFFVTQRYFIRGIQLTGLK
jgi:multiple sugar transport system permease protein